MAEPRWSRAPSDSLTLNAAVHLPRKPNYNFEKRRKELDRQARKEEKRNERARRRREGGGGGGGKGGDAAEEATVVPPQESPSEE